MSKDKSCSSQPDEVIWRKTGQSAEIPCTVTCSDKPMHYEWFVFKESVHLRLNWPDKDQTSLHINSLQANDSGIYYCAAVTSGDPEPGKLYVGLGTTLVVKGKSLLRGKLILKDQMFGSVKDSFYLLFSERVKVMVRYYLLWLSLALLAIYSLALVTFIIKKVNHLRYVY